MLTFLPVNVGFCSLKQNLLLCVPSIHRALGLRLCCDPSQPAFSGDFLVAGRYSKMGDDNVSSSAATFGLHLSSCLKNSRSVWKTPWSNSLLAYDPKPRLPQPLGPLPLLQPSNVPDALSTPSAPHFVRSEGLEQVCAKMAKFKHSSWEVMLNEERNLAVNKWLSLILLEPMAFGVARNFYASKASGIASGSLGDSVSDCLASKATSTINARANSLLSLKVCLLGKGEADLHFPSDRACRLRFLRRQTGHRCSHFV